MLTDAQRAALTRFYSQPEILQRARELYDAGAFEDLESYLHRFCLAPLGNLSDLPDYLKDDEGEPLLPTALNPMADEEIWKDGIEVGWEVMAAKAGFSHDDVHKAIAAAQNDEFDRFLADVERRKRARRDPS